MAVLFGLDVSHHQPQLDFAQCRREGVEYVFIKSSESNNFADPEFGINLANARRAGLLVAAYHYVRSTSTAAQQVAQVLKVVPKDVPVIPDVEAGSGGVALVKDFVSRLRAAGYKVPFTYLPRWYWQQIGSPSLAGLPPLWSSRYPDNAVGSLTSEYAAVPASYWTGYGGLGVAVLQFTSSARVSGYSPLDANAFQGTRAQLAALLGGGDSDMQPSDLVINPATGQPALDTNGNNYTYGAAWYFDNLNGWTIRGEVEDLAKAVNALTTKVAALSLSGVDVQALAAALLPLLPTAAAVADELDRRDRDGNPNTGQVS